MNLLYYLNTLWKVCLEVCCVPPLPYRIPRASIHSTSPPSCFLLSCFFLLFFFFVLSSSSTFFPFFSSLYFSSVAIPLSSTSSCPLFQPPLPFKPILLNCPTIATPSPFYFSLTTRYRHTILEFAPKPDETLLLPFFFFFISLPFHVHLALHPFGSPPN